MFTTLAAVEKDKSLVTSGVFTKDLVNSYLEVKKEEAQQSLLHVAPADFWYYGDI